MRNPTQNSLLALGLASLPSIGHAHESSKLGIFPDWSGTVSYYANCLNLR